MFLFQFPLQLQPLHLFRRLLEAQASPFNELQFFPRKKPIRIQSPLPELAEVLRSAQEVSRRGLPFQLFHHPQIRGRPPPCEPIQILCQQIRRRRLQKLRQQRKLTVGILRNFRGLLHRRLRIVLAPHVKRLVNRHDTPGKAKGLAPESNVLKRSPRCFAVPDIVA